MVSNKNKLRIGIITLVLVLISVCVAVLYSVVDFNLGDFTMSNTQVKNNQIMLSNVPTNYDISDTTWGTNDDVLLAYNPLTYNSISSSHRPGADNEILGHFCSAYGLDYGGCLEESGSTTYYFFWYASNPPKWRLSSSASNYACVQLRCIDNDNYFQTSGSLEQTTPTTTTEKYNHFELDYTLSLNGGVVEPYLVIGTEKHYFVNDVINTNDIMSDTQIKLGFEITSPDDESSPVIDDVVTLTMSYEDNPVLSATGSSSEEFVFTIRDTDSGSYLTNLGNSFLNVFIWIINKTFGTILRAVVSVSIIVVLITIFIIGIKASKK